MHTMQPSQCQLALKTMDQSMLCDEIFLLESTQQINNTNFIQRTFFNGNFLQASSVGPMLTTTPTPAVLIPKSNAYYIDTEDQFESGATMSLTSDVCIEDNLSSYFGSGSDYQADYLCPLSPSLWSPSTEFVKSDDFLSFSKSELTQDPTLAELNANEESLLDNLDTFDLPELLSDDKSAIFNDYEEQKARWEKEKQIAQQDNSSSLRGSASYAVGQPKPSIPFSSSFPSTFTPQCCVKEEKVSAAFKTSFKPKPILSSTRVANNNNSTLHDLLCQYRTPKYEVSHVAAVPSQTIKGQLLSAAAQSAPTKPSLLEQAWKPISKPVVVQSSQTVAANEPSKTTASTSVVDPAETCSSKEEADSHDEGFDSEPEDTDHYEELTSDAESTISDEMDVKRTQHSTSPSLKSTKKERYFWQYNVQAKGPKINRLCLSPRNSDPHHLNEIQDPVFSSTCSMQGIKHSGKARRGDGNDLNPNPRKLYQIGQELRKLNRVINDLTPVSELPFNARPKSRKEKNKLASRACRLKKKAQHEANKLKLCGLENEHRKLIKTLAEARKIIVTNVKEHEKGKEPEKVTPKVEKILKVHSDVLKNEQLLHFFDATDETKIAGNTAEFVNKVLDKMSEGKVSSFLDSV